MGLVPETVLTVGLLALGIYFSVLVTRALNSYLLFRRLRSTALLTWPSRRPANLAFLVALGCVAAAVAVINSTQHRPFHHVYGQGVMALYFLLMAPLLARIPVGLYQDGIWAENGFLPYATIARMAFRETPEIVLILLPRGRSGSAQLLVPPDEYAAVRKLLDEKVRAHVLQMEGGILGL